MQQVAVWLGSAGLSAQCFAFSQDLRSERRSAVGDEGTRMGDDSRTKGLGTVAVRVGWKLFVPNQVSNGCNRVSPGPSADADRANAVLTRN